MNNLERALGECGPQRLPKLMVSHVTFVRHLESILDADAPVLRPRQSENFDTEVLYLSYGTPHYRPEYAQTQDALELPIAILLNPSILDTAWRFYPFDTGAMIAGRFGPKAACLSLDQCFVSSEPDRLVAVLYGDNDHYLAGRMAESVPNVKPLPAIHDFLKADLTKDGVDGRQRTIECLWTTPLELVASILWIGYPETAAAEIRALWKAAAAPKFMYHPYRVHTNENPAALVTHLRKAAEDALGHIVRPPGHQ